MAAEETKKTDGRSAGNNKSGVGAKPKKASEKKKPVQTYITQQQIDDIGGLEKAREVANQALTFEAYKAKNSANG